MLPNWKNQDDSVGKKVVKEKEKKNQIIRESFSTLSKECQLSTPKTLVQVSLNEIDYWPQIQPFVLYKIF